MFGFRVARPLALVLLLTGVSGCDRKTPDEVAPSPQARSTRVKFSVGIPAVGDRFTWSVEERGRVQLGNSANINNTAVIDVEVLAANEWDITSARVHVREHEAEFIDEAGVHTPMRSVVLGSTYLLSWTKDEPLRATHVERGAVTKDELFSLERFVASMRSHSLSARMLDGRSLEQGERLMPLPMEESVAQHKGKRRQRRHDFEATLVRVADGMAHLEVTGVLETFAAEGGAHTVAKLAQKVQVPTEGPLRWRLESDIESSSRAGGGPAVMARGHVTVELTPSAS